jgi:GDPmannose 4,6-dehydratase
VQKFFEIAFAHAGLDPGQHVKSDPAFRRPAEVDQLVGDPAKAKDQLGWEPRHSFRDLVEMMVDADIARLSAVPAQASVSPSDSGVRGE